MSHSPARTELAAPSVLERYRGVRRATQRLCDPLAVEDTVVQSMPDASPTKWHLAHVSWFFETFLLKPRLAGYRPFLPQFEFLFNSYYNQVGDPYPRPDRGLLTRPTLKEVYAYRAAVDEQVERLLEGEAGDSAEARDVLEIGLHHEQQHQELMLMDLKHLFFCNPLYPAYRPSPPPEARAATASPTWIDYPEGQHEIGHAGGGFSYDNERPRHRVFLNRFALASRLVTNGEYREFMEAGGYRRPEAWLAEGWNAARAGGWQAPLYWVRREGGWREFTLGGLAPLDPDAPVCHVSYFEADAFAAWSGARLPGEAEWEVAGRGRKVEGNLAEKQRFHPAPLPSGLTQPGPWQMFGDVWEWTRSAYSPYPGFRAAAGALGEYNGKFMVNQYVLRGGACVTPGTHMRSTYRNFFPAASRWQFSGIRLARDAGGAR